jgi:FkbM family methyltransferase
VTIDVGAHIGTFCLLMIHKAPHGTCYAIEPSLDTFVVLEKNVQENGLKGKLIPCRYALFDRDNSKVKLFHDENSGNWGHSIVSELSKTFEDVTTITLDSFFTTNNIDHCDLIKFNCEGAEFKILESLSTKTLNKIKTWIILFHEDLEKKGNRDNIVRRLKKNGYLVNLIRVNDENNRGWITATKCYRQYIKFSINSKLRRLFK